MIEELAALVDASPNFRFLAVPALLLAGDAALAERYVDSDPDCAMFKGRHFGEVLAKMLVRHAGIHYPETANQAGRVAKLVKAGVIPGHLRPLFEILREDGNEAVHNYSGNKHKARKVVEACHRLGAWWYERQSGKPLDFPFQPPPPAQTASLREQLEKVEGQLKTLQAAFDSAARQPQPQIVIAAARQPSKDRVVGVIRASSPDNKDTNVNTLGPQLITEAIVPSGDPSRLPSLGRRWRTCVALVSVIIAGTAIITLYEDPIHKDPKIHIASPQNNVEVSRSEGIGVTGTVENLTDQRIWIFDLDLDNNHFFLKNDRPIEVVDGQWRFHNAKIGDPGDDKMRKSQQIVVVLGDASCNAVLGYLAVEAQFESLPAGCVEGGRVRVVSARA